MTQLFLNSATGDSTRFNYSGLLRSVNLTETSEERSAFETSVIVYDYIRDEGRAVLIKDRNSMRKERFCSK